MSAVPMSEKTFDGLSVMKSLVVNGTRAAAPDDTEGMTDDEIWDTLRDQPADVDLVMIVIGSVSEAINTLANRLETAEKQLASLRSARAEGGP